MIDASTLTTAISPLTSRIGLHVLYPRAAMQRRSLPSAHRLCPSARLCPSTRLCSSVRLCPSTRLCPFTSLCPSASVCPPASVRSPASVRLYAPPSHPPPLFLAYTGNTNRQTHTDTHRQTHTGRDIPLISN